MGYSSTQKTWVTVSWKKIFLNYTTTNKVAYKVNTGVRDVTLLTEVCWYMWVQPQTIERLHLC